MQHRTRAILALALICLFTADGCGRLVRSASRVNRGYSNSRNQQVPPEQMKIETVDLDATSVKMLNTCRAEWSRLCEKYNATGERGGAQVIAVMDAYHNAHWSEKAKPEDLVKPLGVALGDAIASEGQVAWVLAEGEHVCLCSRNGKVAVAPLQIADNWLRGRKHPLKELNAEIAQAVRDTTGEPKLIGFDEEPEQGERQLR